MFPLAACRPHQLVHGEFDTDAKTQFAAMTTPPTITRKQQINALIVALKAAGVWTQLDLLYVLAAADSQAAGLNWVAPASFALSAVNSPTFTADRGYTFDGSTNYLDTAWDPATNATKLTQNNAHLGVYALTDSSSPTGDFGSGTTAFDRVRARSGTGAQAIVNAAAAVSGTAGVTTKNHVIGARQNDSANQRLYRNGIFEATSATASAALTTVDLNIGRATSAFTNRQLGAAHVGGTLNDAAITAFYAALHAYMVAVGADS